MIIRLMSAFAISAGIGIFPPIVSTASAEPPCRDNDNNGICDDFCPDFDGNGTCDVPGGIGVLPPTPEASNPEFIPGGNPHGADPNMPPVPAAVTPDVSEVLPPGNPPPVVELPENAYVTPYIPAPPVFNPDGAPTAPRPLGSTVPPLPGTEAIPPVEPPADAAPPAVQEPVSPPVQAPVAPPEEEPPLPLLPLPEPPPAQPDYDVPTGFENPSIPLPPSNEQPEGGQIYWVPDDPAPPLVDVDVAPVPEAPSLPYIQPTFDDGSTYTEPDYTYEPDNTYGDSDSTYEPDYTYGDSDSSSSYDSDSDYSDSGSDYSDSDSSYGDSDVVCDEDGYCS